METRQLEERDSHVNRTHRQLASNNKEPPPTSKNALIKANQQQIKRRTGWVQIDPRESREGGNQMVWNQKAGRGAGQSAPLP